MQFSLNFSVFVRAFSGRVTFSYGWLPEAFGELSSCNHPITIILQFVPKLMKKVEEFTNIKSCSL